MANPDDASTAEERAMREALDQPWVDLKDGSALSRLSDSLAEVGADEPPAPPAPRRIKVDGRPPLPKR